MTRSLLLALTSLCSLIHHPQALNASTVVLHDDLLTREIAPEAEQKELTGELFAAIAANDPDAVTGVLMRGVALNVYDENGDVIVDRLNAELLTPLHEAVKIGNIAIVCMLCEVGLREVGREYISIGRFWYFPHWHYRTSIRKVKGLCRRALEYISNQLQRKTTNPIHIASPIGRASFYGHSEIVEFLLKHGECVNRATYFGTTALHSAARNDHVETVALLCEYGASLKAIEEFASYSPIDMAKRYSSTKVLGFLEARSLIRSS